jgi:hypothetical protein
VIDFKEQLKIKEQTEEWRKWYWDAFDLVIRGITENVKSLGAGVFQNGQQIQPWELARLERTIAALHLCCKAMPAMDSPGEFGMEKEVDILVKMSIYLHDYVAASKKAYPVEEPPF